MRIFRLFVISVAVCFCFSVLTFAYDPDSVNRILYNELLNAADQGYPYYSSALDDYVVWEDIDAPNLFRAMYLPDPDCILPVVNYVDDTIVLGFFNFDESKPNIFIGEEFDSSDIFKYMTEYRNSHNTDSHDDPSPDPGSGLDPVVSGSLSEVLDAISQMLASAVSWVGTVSNTVSTTPIFLFAVVLAFVPIGVNLFRRLL